MVSLSDLIQGVGIGLVISGMGIALLLFVRRVMRPKKVVIGADDKALARNKALLAYKLKSDEVLSPGVWIRDEQYWGFIVHKRGGYIALKTIRVHTNGITTQTSSK